MKQHQKSQVQSCQRTFKVLWCSHRRKKVDKGVEENMEDSMIKMQKTLEAERKLGANLKGKIKKLEENMSRLQIELVAEKETSSHKHKSFEFSGIGVGYTAK